MPRRAPRLPRPAAAFVVTLALGPACQKRPPETAGTAQVSRGGDGTCRYHHASRPCPEGTLCNPPPPVRVECPRKLRDEAGADGGAVTVDARPPGKEGWYRIPSELVANPYNGCFFQVEGYCAPVAEDRCEHGPLVKVACKAIDPSLAPDARRFALESFTYKDSFGRCQKVPAVECAAGACPLPPTEQVPCP